MYVLVVFEIGICGLDMWKLDLYGLLVYVVGGGGGGKEREILNFVERVVEEEWGVEWWCNGGWIGFGYSEWCLLGWDECFLYIFGLFVVWGM